MTDTADISYDFARVVTETQYDDIDAESRDRAKQSIMDTLGVIIAASSLTPKIGAISDLTLEMGGTPEATMLGFGGKVPALNAAFANGAMAHCLDFDDHAPEGHHPSSSIVPSAFALAERAGAVSGKEMIAATAIAQDMFLRIRRNVSWKQDWHLTTIIGGLSAAAACARVIKLDHAQTVSAIGIAGHQASGTMELAYGTGSDLRGMYAGFVSKQATLAGLMAQRGIVGPGSMMEGRAGFFATYLDGKYDRDAMLADLGTNFTGHAVQFKAWPSCGLTHSYIHAMSCLMKEQGLTPDDLKQITVHVGDFQERLCTPIEDRRAPKVPVDAKFSIPYCVAVAAVRGTVGLSDFTEDALENTDVLSVASKIVAEPDPSGDWDGKLPYGRVSVITQDGRTFTRIGDQVPGESEAPMDWEYIVQKFREAASFSHKPLENAQIDRAVDMIQDLENLNDATHIIRALS
ncbi:MmgE/PrpD family protein [Celeribacter sp. PS-C1]|uniref:MmgE/PrpD family protein n=1 Tax=Celeribacter sp. PS-C1 TaxID=2820813 RepID=UPI001C6738F1|nr:MmgE/PrpD family protein [Celeribacter sp. PS-C1]MBW6418522.1 MmgE/PrpD family protein [Celeribacter sp. PS-C1]